jgi:hypothetical protein
MSFQDIRIAICRQDADINEANFAASSAGIFCCLTSSSDYGKLSDKYYSFVRKADGCVIRMRDSRPQVRDYPSSFLGSDESVVRSFVFLSFKILVCSSLSPTMSRRKFLRNFSMAFCSSCLMLIIIRRLLRSYTMIATSTNNQVIKG